MSHTPSRFQTAIYKHAQTGSGDTVVEAVAGSGKTTTIVECTKQIDAKEGNVIVCAFNVEIKKELARVLPEGIECKTINGIGHGALMHQLGTRQLKVVPFKYADLIKTATIRLPDNDVQSDIRASLGELVGFTQVACIKMPTNDDLNSLCERYTISLNHGQQVEWYYEKVREVLDMGEDQALKEHVIAFNDQIWLPNLWKLRPYQYQYVFVDEAQDLSVGKLELVIRTRAKGGRMFFVGDSRQSIYGFAGADPAAWNNIIERTNATVLPLSICYRCPSSHIDLAKEIVPQIEARPDAPVGTILNITTDDLSDTVQQNDLIVCRTTAPLLRECMRLLKNGKPARVLGRDIGRQMISLAKSVRTDGVGISEFIDGLERITQNKVNEVKNRKNADSLIQALQDRHDALIACFDGIKPQSYDGFFSGIKELFADSEAIITLATVHRVKGLQRKRVMILNPDLLGVWGKQPWQKEQERNLKYVALTRATDTLIFVRDPQS